MIQSYGFYFHQLQGASLMSDLCTVLDGKEPHSNQNSCRTKLKWKRKSQIKKYPWKVPWQVSLPLQVGGLAQGPPRKKTHGWANEVVDKSFEGCIEHLKINQKVVYFLVL